MPRPSSIDRKGLAISLLYVVLAILRDLTLIAVMTYLISWEVKATQSGNFADTRTLGVASRKSCDTPAQAYGCGAQGVNLTSPSDLEIATNVSFLPVCYSSTLKTTKSKSQDLSLCFGDSNVDTEYSSVPYHGIPLKEYESESTMPVDLQCAYNINNAGSSLYPLESSMLSTKYLKIMFPASNSLSRNYFPFATIIIALCCLAIVMRMTKHLPSRSDGQGQGSGRYSRHRSSSSHSSRGSSHGTVGGLGGGGSDGVERSAFGGPGSNPSRRANIWGSTAEKAQEDMVTRAAVALNVLVGCLLLASASQLSLIQAELCPLDADQASYDQKKGYDEKSYTEEQFYTFCNALKGCNLQIRSVISIDGSSPMDKESHSGFGYRRVNTLFACLLFSFVAIHLLVSAGALNWLFDGDDGSWWCKWCLGGNDANRHRGGGGRGNVGNDSITRITVRRTRSSGSGSGSGTSFYRRMMRWLRLEGSPPLTASLPSGRRSLRTSTSQVSAEGYRNRVPRATGASVYGQRGGMGADDGRSAAYRREYEDDVDDFDFGVDGLDGQGEERADPDGFRFTITSFAHWESREKLRRRNLMLVGLYLGYEADEVSRLLMSSSQQPGGALVSAREGKEEEEHLHSVDNAEKLEVGLSYSSSASEGRAEEASESAFSSSLMLLYFDGENMCPICLQRFQARSKLRQQQLNKHIDKIKALSAVVDVPTSSSSSSSSSNSRSNSNSSVVAPAPPRFNEEEELDRALTKDIQREEASSSLSSFVNNDLGLEAESATVWTFPPSLALTMTETETEKKAPLTERNMEKAPVSLSHEEKEEKSAESRTELQALLAGETVPELDLGETPLILPCGHCFHRRCLYKWLQESPSCPVCRCVVETE